jgi:hypothetical protein
LPARRRVARLPLVRLRAVLLRPRVMHACGAPAVRVLRWRPPLQPPRSQVRPWVRQRAFRGRSGFLGQEPPPAFGGILRE